MVETGAGKGVFASETEVKVSLVGLGSRRRSGCYRFAIPPMCGVR